VRTSPASNLLFSRKLKKVEITQSSKKYQAYENLSKKSKKTYIKKENIENLSTPNHLYTSIE